MENAGKVKIELFNALGQKLETLVDTHRPAGSYKIEFEASDLQSGIYFYRMKADNFTKTHKMILMK